MVKKTGDVYRNYRQMQNLCGIIRLPVVQGYDGSALYMDYIHGMDMNTYLFNHDVTLLEKYLVGILDKFKATAFFGVDYTETYQKKLSWMTDEFSFSREDLISKLPRFVPPSVYHGDMTLENVIWDGKFCSIDPVLTEYDSYVFDIAKLRQDIACGWFTRNQNYQHTAKMRFLEKRLLDRYPEASDDALLILMLLRVYPRCQAGDSDQQFLRKKIEGIWQNIR